MSSRALTLEESMNINYEIGLFEGMSLGEKQGINKGVQKGMQQAKEVFIKNMIDNNIDMETVTTCAGMSADEINELMTRLK